MSPKVRIDAASLPTSLETLEELAKKSDSEPIRTLATELLALRGLLVDAGKVPDLAGQIDRAVAQVLSRTGRDDKGQHFVGAKEIDAAVKWYAAKHKVAALDDDEPGDDALGGALGRGGAE